jgi:hypothetical protein
MAHKWLWPAKKYFAVMGDASRRGELDDTRIAR